MEKIKRPGVLIQPPAWNGETLQVAEVTDQAMLWDAAGQVLQRIGQLDRERGQVTGLGYYPQDGRILPRAAGHMNVDDFAAQDHPDQRPANRTHPHTLEVVALSDWQGMAFSVTGPEDDQPGCAELDSEAAIDFPAIESLFAYLGYMMARRRAALARKAARA